MPTRHPNWTASSSWQGRRRQYFVTYAWPPITAHMGGREGRTWPPILPDMCGVSKKRVTPGFLCRLYICDRTKWSQGDWEVC
jgi:hypothetical protein